MWGNKLVFFAMPPASIIRSQPKYRGNKPVTRGNKPIIRGNKPIIGGNKPIMRGTTKMLWGNKPVSWGGKPVLRGNKPIIWGETQMFWGGKPILRGTERHFWGAISLVCGATIPCASFADVCSKLVLAGAPLFEGGRGCAPVRVGIFDRIVERMSNVRYRTEKLVRSIRTTQFQR